MRLTGFHIEPTNRCVLRCSACERTQFQRQFGDKNWHNQDLDIDALIRFMDMDVRGCDWEICGNTGDPIYHPDLGRLVKWIKSQQGRIWLTTNGSYQKESYWDDVLQDMDSHDVIYFSVDGLPETSPRYRENSDWPTIDRAMRQAVDRNVQAIWKMIPFAFNEHEIGQVRDMAASRGMRFRLDHSDRFGTDDPLRPSTQQLIRMHGTGDVVPACSDGKRHYISSGGFYHPCCWSARFGYHHKTSFYKDRDLYDISKTTLSQVMAIMQGFDERMKLDPMPICSYNCRNT